jgi:hypothetical protein
MVTENSDFLVCFVVSGDLLCDGPLCRSQLVQLVLEGVRGVVCTEHFCSKTIHVASQMFVQSRSLSCIKHVS